MKKSDKYPVKLRVTFQRVTEYYQTVFDLSKEEWEKLPASRISNELQPTRDKLKEIERKAENVITDLDPFSFPGFEKNFIQANANFNFYLVVISACNLSRFSPINRFTSIFTWKLTYILR